MNLKNCKEELIAITTTLIKENNGDVDKVTIRDIASRSGVSVGLINYHFGDKDKLITECVQRIISNIVNSFKPTMGVDVSLNNFEKGKMRLIKTAQRVFGFFFEQPSISRVSILDDYRNYSNESSSYFSLRGFSAVIGDAIENQEEKERISFLLTTSMQVAFLRSLTNSIFLNFDLSKVEDRNKYIEYLVNKLMR